MIILEENKQADSKLFKDDGEFHAFIRANDDTDLLVLDSDGRVKGIILGSNVEVGFIYIKFGCTGPITCAYGTRDSFIAALECDFDCTSRTNFVEAVLKMSYARK